MPEMTIPLPGGNSAQVVGNADASNGVTITVTGPFPVGTTGIVTVPQDGGLEVYIGPVTSAQQVLNPVLP